MSIMCPVVVDTRSNFNITPFFRDDTGAERRNKFLGISHNPQFLKLQLETNAVSS